MKNHDTIKLIRYSIPKSRIRILSREEQSFFIKLIHFLTKLDTLKQCLLFFVNAVKSESGSVKAVKVSQLLFLARLIANELSNGWDMVRDEFCTSRFSYSYQRVLSQEGRDSLFKLKKYFKQKRNTVRHVMDNFPLSSEHSTEIFRNKIAKNRGKESFQLFFLSRDDDKTFSISCDIFNKEVLNGSVLQEQEQAMEKIMTELADKVAGWFQVFGNDCLRIIADRLR